MGVERVLSREELVEGLGLSAPAVRRLDGAAVPDQVRELAHYAAVWGGMEEEAGKNELVDRAPLWMVENLVEVVGWFEGPLMQWLTGAEAEVEAPSEAYVCFSGLVMAADYGKLRIPG